MDDEITTSRSAENVETLNVAVSKATTTSKGQPAMVAPMVTEEAREDDLAGARSSSKIHDIETVKSDMERQMKEEKAAIIVEFTKKMVSDKNKNEKELAQLKQTNIELCQSLKETKSLVEETIPNFEAAVLEKQRHADEIASLRAKLTEKDNIIADLVLKGNKDKSDVEAIQLKRLLTDTQKAEHQKTTKLANAMQNVDKLFKMLQETQKSLDESKMICENLKKIKAAQNSHISSLKEEVAAQGNQIQIQHADREALETKLADEKKARTEVEEQLAETSKGLSAEIATLKKEKSDLQKSMDEKEKIIVKGKATNDGLATIMEQQSTTIDSLKQQVGELKHNNKTLEATNAELTRKFEYALKKNGAMKKYLKLETGKFCAEVARFKTMNEELYASLNDSKQRLDVAESSNAKLQASDTKYQATIAELASQLLEQSNQQGASTFEFEGRIESLESNNESLKQKNETLTEENDHYRDAQEKMSDRLATLDNLVAQYEETIEDLKKKNSTTRTLEKQNEQFREELKELHEKASYLSKYNEFVLEKIKDNSRTYRENYFRLVAKNEKLVTQYNKDRTSTNEELSQARKLEMSRERVTGNIIKDIAPKKNEPLEAGPGGVDLDALLLTNPPSFSYERISLEMPPSISPFLAEAPETSYDTESVGSATILAAEDQSLFQDEADAWFWDWMTGGATIVDELVEVEEAEKNVDDDEDDEDEDDESSADENDEKTLHA